MSCFGCSKKYGLFCKEYGCPNCGYSYCAKCLKRPIAVPRRNNQVCNVCLICYDKLSKVHSSEKVIDCDSLPGIICKTAKDGGNSTLVDVAAIFDEEPPPELSSNVLVPQNRQSLNTSTEESAEIAGNLDSEISKRLKNLKTVDNLPTDEVIRERLSGLTGMPQKNYDKKDLLLSTDQRTEQEKMQDLLEQFMGEAQIDKRVDVERTDAIADIERRLKALRDEPLDGSGAAKTTSNKSYTPSDNEEDDETVLKKVMEKYLAEARLPSELEAELNESIPMPPAGTTASDQKELPWCNICNEDAIYRCKGCDGELFCRQCFKDCHDDDEEYRAHIKENYSAPPNFKNDHF